MIKDVLFAVFGYVGVIAIILVFIWVVLELLNRIFKFSKYIIMYHTFKKNKELYVNKSNIIVNKHGKILYSCADTDIQTTINILDAAISRLNGELEMRDKLREKYSNKLN